MCSYCRSRLGLAPAGIDPTSVLWGLIYVRVHHHMMCVRHCHVGARGGPPVASLPSRGRPPVLPPGSSRGVHRLPPRVPSPSGPSHPSCRVGFAAHEPFLACVSLLAVHDRRALTVAPAPPQ